ncbi:SAM-dependent methyltransferase [Roseicyclus sp.]|uniref:SAM-dependent methyltransferase n=1 Tax=Roseicyclus sp. TaxID=1914329 RepID=UPI003F6A9935
MAQNSPQPRLVDPARLARSRARARLDVAGFLHDEAKAELQERLIDVNRRFTKPALVTPFPEYWADLVPGARLVAPDDVLDLTPGAHDLVIHAMALHWADDPVGQIVQCRRALAPDGLFLSAAFGGETLVELRTALAQAETEVMGGLSPRVAPMAEIRDMGALLQRAGLALPVADRLPKTVTYQDVFALLADLRAMGETNALADRHRRIPPRALFARLSQIYASRFSVIGDEKRIRASFEIVFLSGWAPHDSQQKPLRPGAAKARLADALGTSEFDETARPVLHPSDD